MTLLEILDTAVKVGLGALITACSAYWIAKANALSNRKADRQTRHHDLLEQSAEQIESFSHTMLRYWALITEQVRNREKALDLAPHRRQELDRTKAELFNSFSELTSAESKLLLLGHKECQSHLRSFGDCSREIRRRAFDGNQDLNTEDMESMRDNFLQERASLFDALATAYKTDA